MTFNLWAQASSSEAFSVVTKEVPPASLWQHYGFSLHASGGIEPYHWTVIAGALPNGIRLHPSGELAGMPQESGDSEITVLVSDSSNPPMQARQKLRLRVETPLTVVWERKAQVNGQRIDGSVKVSDRTGRDFDLTFIVLAVNDIGRANAIGYQHFPLKKSTRNFSIPFGDTLSPGNYTVNVDVVGEEPISKRIFRARLVTEKESITQGP
jgi:hypothetical protein